MKSLLTTSIEDGSEIELEAKDYIEFIAQAFNVKEIESETQGKIAPKKAIKYIIDTLVSEKELDPSIKDIPALTDAIAKIQEDVDRTRANAKSAADKAKDDKEAKEKAKAEEKAAKEEKDKALAVRQGSFVTGVNEGALKALGEFAADIEQLKEGLPPSIHISLQGATLDEGATDEDLATGIGYLLGKSHGSTMMNRLLQFTVGDLAEASVVSGIYPDVSAASKGISAKLEEAKIVSMKPNTITAYRQLAVRTPGELRNPEVDPSAYLAISQVNGNPKKMDGESDEAFKLRKETLAADLRSLQQELKDGTIKNRKDVLPKVLEVEYKNGLKTRPTGEDKLSPSKNLLNFFLATLAIEKLDGLHADVGTITFLAEDGTNKVEVATEEVEKLRAEAFNNLLNIYVESKKVKAADILKGSVTEMKKVPMGTDGNGKAITEEQPVKTDVYLPIFFKIETEAEGEGEGDGGGEAAAPEESKTEEKAPEPTPIPEPVKATGKKAPAKAGK